MLDCLLPARILGFLFTIILNTNSKFFFVFLTIWVKRHIKTVKKANKTKVQVWKMIRKLHKKCTKARVKSEYKKQTEYTKKNLCEKYLETGI